MSNIEMVVKESISLKQALKKLEESKRKTLFIVREGFVVASLTDGDIRRYLLNGGKITDLALNAANRKPQTASSIEEARKIQKDYKITDIPIVKNNKLVSIYYEKAEEIYINKVNIPVIINAGGKGTRLEPFTKVLPKPLIPVGDLPILEHIMQRFESFGCKKFYTIVNYKKQLIKAYFKESERKYNLSCIDENSPLGTAGGLGLLNEKIKGDFFFVNCDTLLVSDYSNIYSEHIKRKNDITVVCANKKIQIPFGVIKTNKKKEFVSIEEKPEYSLLTNIGFYIINEKVLNDIPNNTKIDMPEVIELEKKKGRKVSVYSVDESEWLDMGQIPELEKMRKTIYGE